MIITLKTKFTLLNLIILIPVFIVSSYFLFQEEKTIIYRELETKCSNYSSIIADFCKQSILLSDEYQLNQIIEKFQAKETDIIYILVANQTGDPIAYSKNIKKITNLTKKIKYTIQKEQNSIGKTTTILYDSTNIFECLSAININGTDKQAPLGFIDIGLSLNKIQIAKKVYIQKAFLIFAICLGIILLLNYLYAALVLRPIKKLNIIMQEITKDNIDIWVEITGTSEIKKLFDSFKTMMSHIKQKLSERSRQETKLNSQLKEQEQLVTGFKKQLLQTDRLSAIKELCTGISTNFKIPLETISHYIHSISKQLKTHLSEAEIESVKQYISTIDEELAKILDTSNNLINASPFENFALTPIDINQLIEEIISKIKSKFEEKGVFIEQHLSEEVPRIMANLTPLKTAIEQLLINGLQFTEENGEVAIYSVLRNENNIDYVELRIRDTGNGISDEIAGKVFLPFFTTLKTKGHVGLGLTMVDNILKHHNAVLEYSSIKNKGTTFTIKFNI